MKYNFKYSGINYNDFSAAPGICLTVFTQGCPHRCPGCHNPETWNFDGGQELTEEVVDSIINGITAQGITRNLCIMGGEPLCEENSLLTYTIIEAVRLLCPKDVKIYIWTGYTIEELLESKHTYVIESLRSADFLIDGPYVEAERDITLSMRGSRNQRILDLKKYF